MANKDWTGNKRSTYAALGASNHVAHDREAHDYYATDPIAAELLMGLLPLSPNIWECACGAGHLSKVFAAAGFKVRSSDLIDRGYGKAGIDFLNWDKSFDGDIITNPPYKYAEEFVRKALSLVPDGRHVIMFLKTLFLESKGRQELFTEYPPKTVYVSSSRIKCAINGDFSQSGSSAVSYAWFVWEKGYSGITELKWFN
ncbi:MAG: NAD(P)-dependent oxidoreductase [Chitinophagales bacterium]|nr:NAD(P)-dependent oxidoreductase [Chitinophagales bacterium]